MRPRSTNAFRYGVRLRARMATEPKQHEQDVPKVGTSEPMGKPSTEPNKLEPTPERANQERGAQERR